MRSNHRIIVADDNPSIRGPLCFLLEDEGFDVEVAEDGEEALAKIHKLKPSLIFLDVMMPRKDGYEVCEIIKNNPDTRTIYVIILTAKGQAKDRERAIEVGADEYISKPFSPVKIVEKVRSVLH